MLLNLLTRRMPVIIIGLIFAVTLLDCDDNQPIVPVFEKPIITIKDTTFTENKDDIIREIQVLVTGERKNEIILNYKKNSVTAIDGIDFTLDDGALLFPIGNSDVIQSLFLEIKNDDIHEDEAYFEILFSTDSEVRMDKDIAKVTILDEDPIEPVYTYEGYVTPTEYDGWTMIFSDEFSGDQLNEEVWTPVIGNGCPNLCGFGNNELQYYSANNSVVDKGLLTINVLEEEVGSNHYTSSRLKSHHKLFFKYGRLDIRAKLPYSTGLWPALWLMGENKDQVGWPACGEVDVMELKGETPNKVGGTLHYKNGGGAHESSGAKHYVLPEQAGDFSDEFHVFTIEWNEYKIKWSVDDEPFNTVFFTHLNLGSISNPFLEEFFILMNVAVGGNYVQHPDNTTVWPQKMEIDYVRIFQKD